RSALTLLLCTGALPAQVPARLLIHPPAVELHGPAARHRLLVSAVAADGSLTDVTTKATFQSPRPGVVTVAAHGECAAAGDGHAPDEEGKLLREGSRGHHLPLDWVRAGTTGPRKDDLAVQRVEVLPGARLMRPGQEQQLLVRAQFSDGRWKDVTWLTQFSSGD